MNEMRILQIVKNNPIMSTKARTVFIVAVFCILAIAITWTFSLARRLIIAEGQLQTYARLAAKSHASLNYERGKFTFLVSENAQETTASSGTTNNPVVERIPVVSKWDKLYIVLYNEQMSSLLASKKKYDPKAQSANATTSSNVIEGTHKW